jgi:two-component system phosphate regulon sensor histidine kinase PhoR
MDPARRKLYGYAGVIALYVVVFAWWMFFFAHQSDFLLRRMERAGVSLDAREIEAMRGATHESMRMFMFEGAFLGLMLLASIFLVVRSLQRELATHRQQRNFLSAVTHELRSPIASARLYIESLLLGRAEGDKRERYLKNAHKDLDRLNDMVEHLLESARMASAGPAIARERVELHAFTEHTLEELAKEPALQALSVELYARAPVEVDADPAALRTILRNLLSNAAKYGGPKPRVRVSIASDSRHALLVVRDFGPGLAGADPERIFDAFTRGGEELVRTQQGVGLGLFMVAELARAHGGTARALTALDGGGFAVEVALPLRGEER